MQDAPETDTYIDRGAVRILLAVATAFFATMVANLWMQRGLLEPSPLLFNWPAFYPTAAVGSWASVATWRDWRSTRVLRPK